MSTPVQHDRGGDRGHPRRQDGRGLRRRGPRERGRPDARRPVRHARRDQLHGQGGARADLPRAHPGALRRARPRPDGRQERVAASRPPSPSRSRRARASPPASPRTTARARSRWRSTRARARATWSSPATSSRSRPSPAACSSAPARPRRRVDLARLAGLNPSGVICEIMNDDGTMARVPDLELYCEQHDLKMVTVADLIEYRRRHDKLVERVVETEPADRLRRLQRRRLPLARRRQAPRRDGQGRGRRRGRRARARALRVPDRRRLPLAALRLRPAARGRAAADRGGGPRRAALPRPGGPRHRPAQQAASAYKLQEEGLDTVDANLELGLPADLRDYGIGAQILVDLGLTSIRLLTNNPKKIIGLEGYGLRVTDQLPIEHAPDDAQPRLPAHEEDRMGHLLHHQGLALDEEMIHDERVQDRERAEARRRRRAGATRLRARRRALLRGPGRAAGRRARRGCSRRPARASTSTTCPAPSSCRWPRSTAPTPAATPASPAWAP